MEALTVSAGWEQIYLLRDKLDDASDAYEIVELLGGGFVGGNLSAALVHFAPMAKLSPYTAWAADSAFEWLDRYRVAQPELGSLIGNFWELLSVELKSLHKDLRWHVHLQKLGIAPEQLAAFEFDIPLPK